MKKKILLLLLLLTCVARAQISSGVLEPNVSAQMELVSESRGVLIPRVSLQALTSKLPIFGDPISGILPESLLVYNKTENAELKAGYYYWTPTDALGNGKWNRLTNTGDVKLNETLTTLVYVPATAKLTYKDEKDNETIIDLSALKMTVAGGDLTGSYPNPTISRIQGTPVSITTPVSNKQVLMYDGVKWVNNAETLTTLEIRSKRLVYTDEEGEEVSLDVFIEPWLNTSGDKANANNEDIYQMANVGIYGKPSTALHIVKGALRINEIGMPAVTGSLRATDNVVVVATENVSGNPGMGTLKSMPKQDLIQEPLRTIIAGSEVPATLNTQDVFQMGWVGINTKSKFLADGNDEQLTVNGKIVAKTQALVYPDYVLEYYVDGFSRTNEEYALSSLEEVDTFIKRNKHLPGVTPVKELVKDENGYAFNMTDLSLQSLEKIEELYLHAISQQKAINSKDAEILELKQTVSNITERLNKLEKIILKYQ